MLESELSGEVPVFTAGSGTPPRLVVYDLNGKQVHFHHMRPQKRQEKLSVMIKDLFKKHSDSLANSGTNPESQNVIDEEAAASVAAVRAKPPTLLTGLVRELKKSDSDPQLALGNLLGQSNQLPQSQLSERYGTLSSTLGKGSFGVVKMAQKLDPSNKGKKLVYAVKEYHPPAGETAAKFVKRLAAEFCLASSLSHPNIIKTLDLLQEGKSKFFGVMEFCAGGDLYSLIVVAGRLEYVESDCFFKQILRGIAYMHEMGVAHRDVKPENVLLTACGICKLTDFGNAECFRMAWEKDVHLSGTLAGSGPYIAPEEFKKTKFDPRAVDVWAAGVVYMAMVSGRHLWQEAQAGDDFYEEYLAGRKDENGYEPIERLKSDKRRNVVYSVLDPVPNRRLTAKQALNSEWVREIVVCVDAKEEREIAADLDKMYDHENLSEGSQSGSQGSQSGSQVDDHHHDMQSALRGLSITTAKATKSTRNESKNTSAATSRTTSRQE